jgi:hypothetical protein
MRDTVILPGAVASCAIPRPASVTSVEFVEDQFRGLDGTLIEPETSTFTVAGERATRLVGQRDGTFVIAVTVRAVSAQVVIMSPRRDFAQSLAAMLTITNADSNGCPVHASNASILPTGRKPSRAGAADALIPGMPSQVTACQYLATLIEPSSRLDAPHRGAFVAALDALPRGLSRTDTNAYLPVPCRRPGTAEGSLTGQDAMDSEAYVVIADYETGPAVIVVARLGVCGDLGASNGTRTGQRTDALADQFTAAAGNSEGYSGAIHPAP